MLPAVCAGTSNQGRGAYDGACTQRARQGRGKTAIVRQTMCTRCVRKSVRERAERGWVGGGEGMGGVRARGSTKGMEGAQQEDAGRRAHAHWQALPAQDGSGCTWCCAEAMGLPQMYAH